MIFDDFLKTKKMRNVRTVILAAVSRRDLYYVSENESFCFGQKPWSGTARILARHGTEIFGTARIMRARHGNIWHGTDPPDPGTARHGTSLDNGTEGLKN